MIETGYSLTRIEQWFILYLISKIDSISQTLFDEYVMNETEILGVLNYGGIRRVARTSDVFTMMTNLNAQPIRWENEQERGQAVWISSLVYNKKSKEYTFRFDPKLQEFLLELKSYFTSYTLDNIKMLRSKHSIRIYELLAKNKNLGGFVITLERLKFLLGIEGKYKVYSELKRNVLEETLSELNRYTDLKYTYGPHKKQGRRVVSLKFTLT